MAGELARDLAIALDMFRSTLFVVHLLIIRWEGAMLSKKVLPSLRA